jgi:predicted MFS family arabinose efflux permease
MVVGTALVTDIVPRENVDISVAHFATTPWVGAVIGSTAAGFTVQYMGAALTFELAAGLVVVAVVLALTIRRQRSAVSQPVRE